MKRSFSSLGVSALGLALAAGGLYAMWTGWDMILLERGWSLFIAGSVALSGGVVTIALGRVIAHLARLGAGVMAAAALVPRGEAEPSPSPPAHAQTGESAPQAKPENASAKVELAKDPDKAFEGPDFSSIIGAPAKEESIEVDRYTAGDATYVMMSDGSVEVRSSSGTQRYTSLAALRADAEARQR
ncbi:hypothetical protein ACNHKD_11040 [Methylocystis sp. JAN1]|uniref:hypothetical protein n=1 Tax=Methylocystis sp. JAN1 TaxID=3397211 RepID=UPI003FA2A63F